MAVPADADALPVVRRDQDCCAVQIADGVAPAQEFLDDAVALFDLGQVFGVVAASGVTGLVDAEQLQDEQVGVIALDDGPGPGGERVVDLVVVGDSGHGFDVGLAEGVHQVRDAHQLAGQPAGSQRVKYGLALHTQAGHEVAGHAVDPGRRAGEHGTETGHGAGRVHGTGTR